MTNKANPFQAGNVYRRTYKNEVQEVTVLGVTGGKTPTVIYLTDKGAMRTRKQELFAEEFRLFGFNANVGVGVSVIEGRIDGTKFNEYLTWEERVKAAAESEVDTEDEDDDRLTPVFGDAQNQTAILAQQQLNADRLEKSLVSASINIDTATGYHRLTVLLGGLTMLEAQDMFSPLVLGSITGLRYPMGFAYEIDSLEAITPMVADATYLTVHLRTTTRIQTQEQAEELASSAEQLNEQVDEVVSGTALNDEQVEIVRSIQEAANVIVHNGDLNVTGVTSEPNPAHPADEGQVIDEEPAIAPEQVAAAYAELDRDPTLQQAHAMPYGQAEQTVIADNLA